MSSKQGGATFPLHLYDVRVLVVVIVVILMITIADIQPVRGQRRSSVQEGHKLSAAVVGVDDSQPGANHWRDKRFDLESCLGRFDVHRNTIIRTGESQAIGGKYLQGLELDTMDECQRLCCETEHCDVYIFENKNDGYCYLFECGPPENFHCKFTRHGNYTSAVLTPPLLHAVATASTTTGGGAATAAAATATATATGIAINANVSQQERELTSLKLKVDAMMMPQTEPRLVAPRTSGANASTTMCGRFQFSCHSGECIAVYNACDGIPQCEDGSDEGPECLSASSLGGVAATNVVLNKYTPEQLNRKILESADAGPVAPPDENLYQATSGQQQQQQPPPPPPPQHREQQATYIAGNREDSTAWLNRKLALEGQQNRIEKIGAHNSHIFNHKGGLQVPANVLPAPVASSSNANLNANYAVTLQRSGIYPPSATSYGEVDAGGLIKLQQQQQQQQQGGRVQAEGDSPFPPAVKSQQATVTYDVMKRPPLLPLPGVADDQHPMDNERQPPVPPPPPPPSSPQRRTEAPMVIADRTQPIASDKDTDEYSDEVVTEPPKKHKHKKMKAKMTSAKELPPPPPPPAASDSDTDTDAIVLALEQQKQRPLSAVHEQYKIIHENLAMEFRDHDGQSERPGGAVLSLTLGLLVTAALAILIGCRLRTVGRRARRLGGKAPYAHEADFLVNGMYL